jgi:hypothetical protein
MPKGRVQSERISDHRLGIVAAPNSLQLQLHLLSFLSKKVRPWHAGGNDAFYAHAYAGCLHESTFPHATRRLARNILIASLLSLTVTSLGRTIIAMAIHPNNRLFTPSSSMSSTTKLHSLHSLPPCPSLPPSSTCSPLLSSPSSPSRHAR